MKRHFFLSLASIIGACVALLPRGAAATQPLEAFIAGSKTHSFDARETAAVFRQREAESEAALGRLLPVFSARGVYTRNQYEVSALLPGSTERLVIQPQNQWDAFLQLDVPLIDFANYYRYRSSRAVAEASAEQRRAAELDVTRAVARAYYQFLGASALARSARQSVEAAETNYQDVAARVAAGAVTDLDLERARANLERARQDVADAELLLSLSARNLETLTGLSPEPAQSFPEDALQPEAPLQTWLARAGETPQDRVARATSEATRYSRKAANAALLPTLTGTAQERFTNATGFAGRSANYTLQLTLAWRLDYATLATSRAQSAAQEAQLVREERTQRSVSDSIFEAYQRVQAGVAKSRSARAQYTAAQRAATLASDRYAAGMATQLDVTQAQREAFLADAARIQADADLAYARSALRLVSGLTGNGRRVP